MIDVTQHNFGGRLQTEEKEVLDYANLVDLANQKLAFVYQRLSSHEQVKKSIWSQEAQDNLVELAKKDGYPDGLIYVEKRDLGISGTKGQEDRPGLAYLIQQVEAGLIEAIYIVHVSRLWRDQTLVNAFALGELLKEHNVILVTPQMRLNLGDKMHMRIYRMEAERAADELDLMSNRLLGARDLKARAGFYGGESLPVGYIVDEQEELDDRPNPDYHTFKEFKPHSEVVRTIFEQLAIPGMTPTQVARYCKRHSIAFPPFPPELDTRANRKGLLRSRLNADESWPVTVQWVRAIATNPAYIGWRVWGGKVTRKDAFPPIIDEETFWIVQERFSSNSKSRPKSDADPLPLSGLLHCGEHEVPRKMSYANREPAKYSLYQCIEYGTRSGCANITASILDGPISEAVISQITLPGLAEEVLSRLTDEYEQAKEKAASYRREMRRLEAEIDNLSKNLASNVLSPETLARIDQGMRERMARIRELADLESQPIGQAVGRPAPGQEDIALVKSFLESLGEQWSIYTNGLRNVLLRLLLDKVTIWHNPQEIRVKLLWRAGLEQQLLILRPCDPTRESWSDSELAILHKHYETASKEELTAMLPNRSWRAITMKGKRLDLSRVEHIGRPTNKTARRLTPEEDALIKRYYAGEIGLEEAMSTGRTPSSIKTRASRLGLKRQRKVVWEWIDDNGILSKIDVSSISSR